MDNLTRPTLIPSRLKFVLGGSLLITSAIAWIASLRMADGMAMGFWGFILAWTVMMAAMMLPAVIPTVWLFAADSKARAQSGFRPAPTAMFVAGYLGAWALVGIAVAPLNAISGMAMAGWSKPIAGGVLIIAGAYQFTRWKALSLSHCRAPTRIIVHRWRGDGLPGALLTGAHHGLYCIGSCWALMATMVALGMMNLKWMGLIVLLILIEIVSPWGNRVALLSGGALILLGAGMAGGIG